MAIPIIRLDSLPLQSLGSGNSATIPVVLDNTTTVRIPWSDFIAGTAKTATTVPAAPSSPGQEQSQIASDEGLYVYGNGTWHKAPLYSNNWEDLSKDTRFLLVNKLMSLSDEQIKNVYNTLQLALATQEKAGLVRAMTDEEAATVAGTAVKVNTDGTMYVPAASDNKAGTVVLAAGQSGPVVTEHYVNTRFDSIPNLPIPAATTTARGGVLSGGTDGAFVVDPTTGAVTLRSATDSKYGIVLLATKVDSEDPGTVPTTQAVYEALNTVSSSIGNLTPEAYTRPGLVCVAAHGAWNDTSNPSLFAPTLSGPIYVKTDQGALDVYPATFKTPGVVLTTSDVNTYTSGQNYETVPTASAVKTYVAAAISDVRGEIPDGSMPVATTGSLGGVIVGSGLRVTAQGLLSLKEASSETRGGVLIAADMGTAGVPYATTVKQYADDIESRLSAAIEALEERVNAMSSDSSYGLI